VHSSDEESLTSSEDEHRRKKSKKKKKRSKGKKKNDDGSSDESSIDMPSDDDHHSDDDDDVRFTDKSIYREGNEDEDVNIILNEIRTNLRTKLLTDNARNLKKLAGYYRSADKDGHGLLSRNKFKSITMTKLKGRNKLNRGEVLFMLEKLRARKKGFINYEKLKEVLTDGEVLFDDDDDESGWQGFTSEEWAVRTGSVGEFLQNIGTPQDRRNFRDFMTVIEGFERSHGTDSKRSIKIEKIGNVVNVKLGPMLSVAMKFYVE